MIGPQSVIKTKTRQQLIRQDNVSLYTINQIVHKHEEGTRELSASNIAQSTQGLVVDYLK